MKKRRKKKLFEVRIRINFRGGEREPAYEYYELIAFTPRDAIKKAKRLLLKHTVVHCLV